MLRSGSKAYWLLVTKKLELRLVGCAVRCSQAHSRARAATHSQGVRTLRHYTPERIELAGAQATAATSLIVVRPTERWMGCDAAVRRWCTCVDCVVAL